MYGFVGSVTQGIQLMRADAGRKDADLKIFARKEEINVFKG